MEEILREIQAAEARADAAIAAAKEEAKRIEAEAVLQAERVTEEAKRAARAGREARIRKAEEDAARECGETAAEAKRASELRAKAARDRLDEIAAEIAEGIVHGCR